LLKSNPSLQRVIQCDNTGEQLSLCNNRFSFSSSFSSTSGGGGAGNGTANSYNLFCSTSKPVNLFKSTKSLDERESDEEDNDDEDDDDDEEDEEDDDDQMPFMSLSTVTKNNDTISFLSQSQISVNQQPHFVINSKSIFQRSQLVVDQNHDQFMDSIDEDL
jgi:hypothetical protein